MMQGTGLAFCPTLGGLLRRFVEERGGHFLELSVEGECFAAADFCCQPSAGGPVLGLGPCGGGWVYGFRGGNPTTTFKAWKPME